jgi:Peptidase A4 family
VAVSSPAVQSGDLLYVDVWNTSSTTGYIYLDNITTNVTALYSITAPAGTTLKGESVEWITERPGINGGLANLMNYVDASWVLGVAWNYQSSTKTYQYIGQASAGLTLDAMTMLDNNGNPISLPYIENSDFLWMKDTGSAYKQ